MKEIHTNQVRNQFYITFCLGAVLLLLSLLATPVRADSPVTIKVEAGFDGFAKTGHMIPLRVDAENTGPPVNGVLQVETLENESRVIYARKVNLPEDSKKSFTIYVPFLEGNRLEEVKLMAGGAELASARPRLAILNPSELTIGVLASEPAALNHLGGLKFPGEKIRVTVMHLQARELPVKSLALESLDVLVINDFPTDSLSRSQAEALQGWVEQGGTLVLGGGAAWQKTIFPLPESLVPVEITGSRVEKACQPFQKMVGHRLPSGDLVISEGRSLRGNRLVEAGDDPLVVDMPLGRGHVFYLAFDPVMEPFTAWVGNQRLWLDLLTRADPHQAISSPNFMFEKMGRRGNMGWVLRNIPASDLPSTAMLGGILLIYILILGPGLYLLLGRLDRREWGWVAIPLIALLSFAITYQVGFKGKGRDVFTNVISVVSLEPGTKYARVTSYLGVFAPTRNDYQVDLDGEKLIRMLPVESGPYRVARGAPNQKGPVVATVWQEAGRVDLANSTRWSMRCLLAEDMIPNPGQIESRLSTSEKGITGTVTNKTSSHLTDCVVYSRYGFQNLGKLAPGETAAIEIQPRVSLQHGGVPFYRIYQSYPVHYPRQTGNSYIGGSLAQKRAQIMENVVGQGFNLAGNEVIFAGWSQDDIKGVLASGQSGRTYFNTLYTAPLGVRFQTDSMAYLPPGLVNGRLVDSEARDIQPEMVGQHMHGGMAAFQLDLPVTEPDWEIDELVILAPVGDFRQARITQMALYNWSTGKWDEVSYQPLGIPIQLIRTYVSEAGSIQIKIGPRGTDAYIYLGGVTVGMKAHQRGGTSTGSVPGVSSPVEGGI